jgi:hypothetical protein
MMPPHSRTVPDLEVDYHASNRTSDFSDPHADWIIAGVAVQHGMGLLPFGRLRLAAGSAAGVRAAQTAQDLTGNF